MPDKKGNLYLYEAIELRNEYDRHVELLEGLLGGESSKKRGLFTNEDEDKEPSADFDQKETEDRLKKFQTKRVRLNQEIQKTNFETQIEYEGKKISIAEALEVRKNLLVDVKVIAARVGKSSHRRVIHKEGRDIVQEPRHKFIETYKDYLESIRRLRGLVTRVHAANHSATVVYKDE
ncbi:MAG: hypothetical protein MUO31_07850 [Thermodesulfovibrionales bacterium]|nr:hypothetical protein [Thermodesulfovibrionales bacterium]